MSGKGADKNTGLPNDIGSTKVNEATLELNFIMGLTRLFMKTKRWLYMHSEWYKDNEDNSISLDVILNFFDRDFNIGVFKPSPVEEKLYYGYDIGFFNYSYPKYGVFLQFKSCDKVVEVNDNGKVVYNFSINNNEGISKTPNQHSKLTDLSKSIEFKEKVNYVFPLIYDFEEMEEVGDSLFFRYRMVSVKELNSKVAENCASSANPNSCVDDFWRKRHQVKFYKDKETSKFDTVYRLYSDPITLSHSYSENDFCLDFMWLMLKRYSALNKDFKDILSRVNADGRSNFGKLISRVLSRVSTFNDFRFTMNSDYQLSFFELTTESIDRIRQFETDKDGPTLFVF